MTRISTNVLFRSEAVRFAVACLDTNTAPSPPKGLRGWGEQHEEFFRNALGGEGWGEGENQVPAKNPLTPTLSPCNLNSPNAAAKQIFSSVGERGQELKRNGGI